ncbi:MAG: hypothetical protein ACI8ZB_004242 [Desulforhopalus sp.]|jgi:hypothetical protein
MMKPTPVHLSVILIIGMFFFSLPSVAEENRGWVAVTSEVEKLIEFVRMSKCTFYRNGSWSEAGKAADHINKKYRYVQKKGLVRTTEDFITYAATKSSISGRPYLVKCGDAESQKCAEWLRAELIRLRNKKPEQ